MALHFIVGVADTAGWFDVWSVARSFRRLWSVEWRCEAFNCSNLCIFFFCFILEHGNSKTTPWTIQSHRKTTDNFTGNYVAFFFCLFTNHWPRANDRPFPRLTNILNNQISVCRICRADRLQSFAHSHEFRSSEALLNAMILWAQQSHTLRTHIMCSAYECMDESPKMLDGYCLLFQPDYVLYIQICCCWFYETRLVSGNPALGNGPKHNTNTYWTF